MSLTVCLNFLRSARASPVAWEGEAVEGVDNNQPSQPGGPENHSSPGHNQGQRRSEAEEEPKNEQTQREDEGSTSGVGVNMGTHIKVQVLTVSIVSIQHKSEYVHL